MIKIEKQFSLGGKTILFFDSPIPNKKFTKQLEKASKIANYALILGEDEINSKQVSVKNLKTSTQNTIAYSDIFKFLNK